MWNINSLFSHLYSGKRSSSKFKLPLWICELRDKEFLQGLGFVVNSSETYRIKYKIILTTKDNHSFFIFSHTHYD